MSNPLKGVVPDGHIYIRGNVLEKGNPIGVAQNRAAWAKELNLPREAEYTFFAGCGYQSMRYAAGMMGTVKGMEKVGMGMNKLIGLSKAFEKVGVDLPSIGAKVTTTGKKDSYTKVLASTVSVLQKIGIDIAYLYENEPCCGSPIYYSGFEEDYRKLANSNYKLFYSLGIKKIIGLIPACTSSLRDIYPKYVEDYDLEVMHFFEIVASSLRQKKIKPKLKENLTVTYHEPCQLSRYLNIIDEPREILNSIEGLELRDPDPEQCEKWSTCCGGGGLEASHPELSDRVGARRIEELLETEASIIATNCPACMMQLSKAVKNLNEDVKVMDVIEILDKAIA
jgi:Fe-S oxidoreductase